MDCLPPRHEWSIGARWLFIKEHLAALRWHLETLEQSLAQGAVGLIAERQHLAEICQRGVETHTLLEQLSQLPPETLADLN